MRKYLLPEGMKAYKANLHTHSNLSDGHLTPAELAEAHRSRGYSILAITDHEFIIDHSDLSREDFLMLTGYELQVVDPVKPRKMDQKCCHMCLISKDPHSFRHIYFHPDDYDLRRLCHVPEKIPEMEYVGARDVAKYYDVELINDIARQAGENGFLIAYNHPGWSLEPPETFANLKGFYAMEIYNSDCNVIGLDEYNPWIYDCMLRHGQRLGCIAADDAHAKYPIGDPMCDMFRGWTMIFAEKLGYGAVIDALEKQNFYASTGPEIKELYYEDGLVHVKTDDVQSICMTTSGRRSAAKRVNRGESLSEAAFEVKDTDGYIRITVKDQYGMPANTRAYFLDEFFS